MAAETDEIAAIEDIGPKIAESVVTYFASPVNIDLIERLKELGLNMEMEAAELDTAHPFYGKTMVFTGTMPTLDRATAQTMAQQVGAKVTGSVSKNGLRCCRCGSRQQADESAAAGRNRYR